MSNDTKRKMEDLVRLCATLPGWRVDEGRRHWIVYPPKPYAMITMGRTPSDAKAFKNALGDVNRVLRALGRPEVMR